MSVGVYEKVSKEPSGKSVKNTFEIDFFATKGIRQYYIQVCNDLSSPSTYEREIKPYLSLVDEIQKIIVVNSPIEESRTKEGYWQRFLASFYRLISKKPDQDGRV